ncbi:1,2-phenylacetyl-CoA epoxidase subunit PaaD [Chitinophaga nivalis]|uniref:Phenylacetate-CoA oxygenase subunit PaaJ n=1 Tax=Chitinophaga nivalis TaxID=2991709 RepID=A0ABT3IW51_9BACT|nr:1,2-phenylacetyl-CoA epoxidase subunit PaaD [Chitinophaga nivalis]MCW3462379.1 phenylacetate-CoA oxygenase subunit PaaJ [Chitinophaga nivalis]MCW3487930.1 phenylacetate-CoA oxygenase subunit PaaJ [Chitinophaga nivalis]
MGQTISIAAVYQALESVMDPEIPVLSVLDLGMITDVSIDQTADVVHIRMIPTFAACPAVSYIQNNIKTTVEKELGIAVTVEIDKQVHWESNRITPAAKEKLKNFGIAPPQVVEGEMKAEIMLHTPCPHCSSEYTYLRSPFGSTLCRAIHFCKSCGQVFEQFKPLE